jgi:hypothetical protein
VQNMNTFLVKIFTNKGFVSLKMKLKSFQNNQRMFLSIAKEVWLYFGLSSHEQTYVARELCRDQAKNFNTLVEYLGLSDEIVVPVEETDEIVPIRSSSWWIWRASICSWKYLPTRDCTFEVRIISKLIGCLLA